MDIVIETLHETIVMIPVLFITYVIIEYLEKYSSNLDKIVYHMSKAGPLYGALIGLIPQCGFSVLAASLFASKKITLGTLMAVFIASNDEALVLLLSQGKQEATILYLVIGKILLAIIIGILCDCVFEKRLSYRYGNNKETTVEHHIVKDALLKTVKIYMYVMVVNIGISFLMVHFENELTQILKNSSLEIVAASLIGFIPNCAISVIVVSLYTKQLLSFAALFAALISNTGLGILMLFKSDISRTSAFKIVLLLWLSALVGGILCLWI